MIGDAAEFAPHPGQVLALRDDLALVLAPNPSPMTGPGTNTYLLGRDRLIVIDPGPAVPSHLDAVLDAIGGRSVDLILVTHSHLDHSALAPALAAATGASVCAFGGPTAGRSAAMTALAARGLTGGGEGIDRDFAPDRLLADADVLQGDWGQVTAIHTPGHIGNHLCFLWGDALFSGDHVMGWASSLVSPPDGDLTDFMASCRRLQQLPAACFYPGHGAPVPGPQERLAWLIAHRLQREAQIIDALSTGPATPQDITARVYADLSPILLMAAERNVLAHLIDLHGKGTVIAMPDADEKAVFQLARTGLPPVTGI
ncbi:MULTISPECIES: MBL fold metallo-hydrolase [unclassified Yoonia]|uniref:MBL fold metallo-hydrolase n=1 Tax=unclassified Yoonia TaxID=2629118 RepID=UPI002AFEA484|nr:MULTISPECIES: MBL fold metallo-hydrolase [unclassified Yoonia]